MMMNNEQLIDISFKSINYLRNVQIYPNSCLIFDIDDTLISNNGRGGLIVPIFNILIFARNLGIKIVLITSRPVLIDNIVRTVEQLTMLGITYDFLYMKKQYGGNDYQYKREARKHVYNNKGLKTLMTFGDNVWDVFDDNSMTNAMYSGIPVLLRNNF